MLNTSRVASQHSKGVVGLWGPMMREGYLAVASLAAS